MPRISPIYREDPLADSLVEWEDLPSLLELVMPRVSPIVVRRDAIKGLDVIEHFEAPPVAASGFADTLPGALL